MFFLRIISQKRLFINTFVMKLYFSKMEKQPQEVVLIGAGIISATLSILLKKINPAIKISVFEKLDKIGF